MNKIVLGALALLSLASCNQKGAIDLIAASKFDTTLNQQKVSLYTLKNKSGMVAQITNYGARLVSLWVPSKDGSAKDIVWGYGSIKEYLSATDVFAGPIVGRYGNRIGKGKFSIDGQDYTLSINNNGNHLHGGPGGFWTKVWAAKQLTNASGEDVLELRYSSPNGEEGYPGNVVIKVSYTLTGSNELKIEYEAEADAPTIMNPTSHCYFNLHGTSEKSTNTHVLQIFADSYTPTDSLLIPTGEIAPLGGTPLDFRKPTKIGDRIDAKFEAIAYGKGYDHNFVLNKGSKMGNAAVVYEPETGIEMTVSTNQPGLQFYSGNFMDGVDTGKRGQKHSYRTGIALETQNFPDAPNHPNFPNSVLRPNEKYSHTCIYAFRVK